MKEISSSSGNYPSDLTDMQRKLVYASLDGMLSRQRKYKKIDMLNAIAYVVRSGCQ